MNKIISGLILLVIISFLGTVLSWAGPFSETEKEKFEIENMGMLTGRAVLKDGSPLPYGFISFFEKTEEFPEHQDYGVSKRSPLMVSFVDKDGRFSTQLFPEGKYFVGAVLAKKWMGGPPKSGQKKYSAFDSNGEYSVVEVKAAETIDVGDLVFADPEAFPERERKFILRGRVLDEKGGGVIGAVVVAKKDINDPKGDFISKPTTLLGVYELVLPPGKYFFVARKELTVAGRPKPGGLMGTLGMDNPMKIGGKTDEIPDYIIGKDGNVFNDVNITMFEVPIPEQRRKEIEAKVKAKEINKSTLPDDLPLMKKKIEKAIQSEHQPE